MDVLDIGYQFSKSAEFFAGIMDDFCAGKEPTEVKFFSSVAACADGVFSLLTHRDFTHLSKKSSLEFKNEVVEKLTSQMVSGEVLHFDLDLGPAYHASIKNDFSGLNFEPGLGELLVLRQILKFTQKVQSMYAPGARFNLVMDDVCAWFCNDIALSLTQQYLQQLDSMIRVLDLGHCVAVLAESSLISGADYKQRLEALSSQDVPSLGGSQFLQEGMVENISRFVGYRCTPAQAYTRWWDCQRAQKVSERLLQPVLKGVRLTQRATQRTLGFRAFPGADARLQCGEVDVCLTAKLSPRAQLITYKHHGLCTRWPVPAVYLPAAWPLPELRAHVVVFHPTVRQQKEVNF